MDLSLELGAIATSSNTLIHTEGVQQASEGENSFDSIFGSALKDKDLEIRPSELSNLIMLLSALVREGKQHTSNENLRALLSSLEHIEEEIARKDLTQDIYLTNETLSQHLMSKKHADSTAPINAKNKDGSPYRKDVDLNEQLLFHLEAILKGLMNPDCKGNQLEEAPNLDSRPLKNDQTSSNKVKPFDEMGQRDLRKKNIDWQTGSEAISQKGTHGNLLLEEELNHSNSLGDEKLLMEEKAIEKILSKHISKIRDLLNSITGDKDGLEIDPYDLDHEKLSWTIGKRPIASIYNRMDDSYANEQQTDIYHDIQKIDKIFYWQANGFQKQDGTKNLKEDGLSSLTRNGQDKGPAKGRISILTDNDHATKPSRNLDAVSRTGDDEGLYQKVSSNPAIERPTSLFHDKNKLPGHDSHPGHGHDHGLLTNNASRGETETLQHISTQPTELQQGVSRVSMSKDSNGGYFDNLRSHLVNQLGHGILNTIQLKRNKAVLQLHPPELGRVRIELVMSHQNQVHASFITETIEARHLIQSGLEDLKAQLHASGFSLESCNVGLGSSGQDGRDQPMLQEWRSFTTRLSGNFISEEPEDANLSTVTNLPLRGVHIVI